VNGYPGPGIDSGTRVPGYPFRALAGIRAGNPQLKWAENVDVYVNILGLIFGPVG